MSPSVSNDRATPRSLHRKSLSISVPAQQKSGASLLTRDPIQPSPVVRMCNDHTVQQRSVRRKCTPLWFSSAQRG